MNEKVNILNRDSDLIIERFDDSGVNVLKKRNVPKSSFRIALECNKKFVGIYTFNEKLHLTQIENVTIDGVQLTETNFDDLTDGLIESAGGGLGTGGGGLISTVYLNIIRAGCVILQYDPNFESEIKVALTAFRISRSGSDVLIHLDGALTFKVDMAHVTVQDGYAGAPVVLTPVNWDVLTYGLNDLCFGGGSSGYDGSGWSRPFDRPSVPVFADADEQAVWWLFGVQEYGMNDYAFSITESSGSYKVDWGDGTIDTVASNTACEHAYNFASLPEPVCSEGYKWVWIKATPVAGDFTGISIFRYRPSWSMPIAAGKYYCPKVFEIYIQGKEVVSMPFASSYLIYSHLLNVFDYRGSNKITSFNYLLWGSASLKRLKIYTGNATSFFRFLQYCYSFNEPLDISTSNGTTFTGFMYSDPAYNKKIVLDLLSCTTPFDGTEFSGMRYLPALRLLNMGTIHDALSLAGCNSLDSEAVMALCGDLCDRTGLSAGTLTLTDTPASIQLTPLQLAEFALKNWTVIL